MSTYDQTKQAIRERRRSFLRPSRVLMRLGKDELARRVAFLEKRLNGGKLPTHGGYMDWIAEVPPAKDEPRFQTL